MTAAQPPVGGSFPRRPQRAAAVPSQPPQEPVKANGTQEQPGRFFDPRERRLIAAVEELNAARRALERSSHPGAAEWARQHELVVEVHPLGLGFEATATEGVMLSIARLRDSRGDLTGELDITRWGNHLYRSRFNLSSGQARISTARLLSGHPAGKDIDWRELLEQVCLGALTLAREGDPLATVGTDPQPTELPRVVDPYLPLGPTLLWGPQGSGKSTLAVAVVITLETFAEVLPDWVPRDERRCLVLDWESSPAEWNDRLQRVARGAGVEPPEVAYRRCRTPLADMVEELSADIARREIGFLVIDSFEKAAGARSEGSTYEEKAERVFLALDRLARPSLLLDHVGGDDLRQGLSRVVPKSIGSTLKGAWARATYDLKRDPDRSTTERVELLLHNVKINDGRPLLPYEFSIVYDGERGPIHFERSRLTSPELLKSLPQAEQMYRLLLGGSKSTKALAEEMETTEKQIRVVLSRDHGRRFMRLPDQTIGLTMAS